VKGKLIAIIGGSVALFIGLTGAVGSALTIALDIRGYDWGGYTYTAPLTVHEITMIVLVIVSALLFLAGLAVLIIGLVMRSGPKQAAAFGPQASGWPQAPGGVSAPGAAQVPGTSGALQVPGAAPAAPAVREWYCGSEGTSTGPYYLSELQQMAVSGQIVSGTWIWKPQMTSWAEAKTLADLAPWLRA